MDEPIRIRDIKRFVLEYGAAQGWKPEVDRLPKSGKQVAVIGAGPAGIAAAWDLARAGHAVTVFEAQKEPGGMLRYGIPSFRLPAAVLDAEIAALKGLGVKVKCNKRLGKDFTLASLKEEATTPSSWQSAARPAALWGAPARRRRASSPRWTSWATSAAGRRPRSAGTVAVIGGGFTAVDTARTARAPGREAGLPLLPAHPRRDARGSGGGVRGRGGGRARHLPRRPDRGAEEAQQGDRA